MFINIISLTQMHLIESRPGEHDMYMNGWNESSRLPYTIPFTFFFASNLIQ